MGYRPVGGPNAKWVCIGAEWVCPAALPWQALSNTDWSSYCLVHLFTFRRFTGSTLGVAYTAPPTSEGLGGVCSQCEESHHALLRTSLTCVHLL